MTNLAVLTLQAAGLRWEAREMGVWPGLRGNYLAIRTPQLNPGEMALVK